MKMMHIYEQRFPKKFRTLFSFEGDNKAGGLRFIRKKYIKSKLVGFTFSKSFSRLRIFLLQFSLSLKLKIPKFSFAKFQS